MTSRTRPLAALVVVAGLAAPATTGPASAQETGVRQELAFQDPELRESSGLVVRGDDLLTIEDSGGGPVVLVVDADTGETVGRTTYSERGVVDVEALGEAPDGAIWVADVGDNRRQRDMVTLYRLPAVERGERSVAAERFDLVYPDGARDAEALLVHPRTGRMHVVTKGFLGGEVYAVPSSLSPSLSGDRPGRLRLVGSAPGTVTDGTWLPDGRSVVLRDYAKASVVDPATWEVLGTFPLPDQQQGEAVAPWPPGDRVLVSSEGPQQPLWSVAVPTRLLPRDEETDEEPVEEPVEEPADGPAGPAEDPTAPATEDAPAADPADGESEEIPLGPAVAGGVLLVALALGGLWLLRRRVRGARGVRGGRRRARSRP